MDDFSLNAIGRADWYSRKPTIDPKKRQRHHDDPEPSEEPTDSVVLSSDEGDPLSSDES